MLIDIIVSSPSASVLAAKLVDVGLLVLGEGGARPPTGILHTHIEQDEFGFHELFRIDDSKVGNASEIVALVPADMLNVAGAPLRAWAGSLPPEVVDALPDWAYRKALDRLALTAAWDTAVAAAGKDAQIWWDRAIKISTLEDEWKAIVAEMVWGDETERRLINRAHTIAAPKPAEPVVTP